MKPLFFDGGIAARRSVVMANVQAERERHASLIARGRFINYFLPDVPNEQRLTVLSEEAGEVSREVCEELHEREKTYTAGQRTVGDMITGLNPKGSGTVRMQGEALMGIRIKLRKELIQVAAVAVAWCEALDAEDEENE